MVDQPDDLAPEAFARIALALAGAEDRAAVLASFGLDEERWERLESAFQDRLSDGLSAHPEDEDSAPPEIEALSRAFAGPTTNDEPAVSFEAYVELTRAMQSAGFPNALAKAGVDLPTYLRAHEQWVRRMTRDADLARRFADALGTRRT